MRAEGNISANEVNKFVYCPYQWYYERIHGAKKIRGLYMERNKSYGYTDTVGSHFKKGLRYHSGYRKRALIFGIITVSAVVLAVFGLMYFLGILPWK